MNTKNAFSAAQSKSKKMAGKMASNDINARFAANVLTAANACKAYSAGKQTAAQLATQYGCGSKTIYRHLHKASIKERYPCPGKANIIMDTAYFA
ncbi:hypothetical protein [Cardiobacterium hominis]|uniref:hypothetical protein n=1 Tax=Cardiobacterium hominis TaxID=2718 RepID=UPI0028E66584|nr:hypothetical protein [Cardiobacterium hominis]